MTKTGGNYNATTINVSLNKATFNTPEADKEAGVLKITFQVIGILKQLILAILQQFLTIRKVATFSGNPPQNATVTLRIFDGNGTEWTRFNISIYRLESIFTETLLTVVPCTGELKIVVNEVVVGVTMCWYYWRSKIQQSL